MTQLFCVPDDIPALHEALVEPLLRAADFRLDTAIEAGSLQSSFFVAGEIVSSRRLLMFARRHRVSLLERRAIWRGCRNVEIRDTNDIGVYKLHSIVANESTVLLRAQPDLEIEVTCEAVELFPPEPSIYEMERFVLGSWVFGSYDALLGAEGRPDLLGLEGLRSVIIYDGRGNTDCSVTARR